MSDASRDAILSQVVTADEAFAWITETVVRGEVVQTEENNEDRTLADYLADVENVLSRIREGDGYEELLTVEHAVAVGNAPKTVMVAGNPFDGMRIVGPFPGEDNAITEYAETHTEDYESWWIVDLHAPESEG